MISFNDNSVVVNLNRCFTVFGPGSSCCTGANIRYSCSKKKPSIGSSCYLPKVSPVMAIADCRRGSVYH